MTAVPANPRVSELRDLFRYLSDFRATYESTGLDVITTPHGNTWSLWDLEYLYRIACERLTLRQQQAITLCLIHGVKESDAAELMGVSRTNPVMMYASLGLQRLIDMMDFGELTRFNRPLLRPEDLARRHVEALAELAKEIEAKLIDINGCLLFPNRSARPPRLMVRSSRSITGYVPISPMQVLWLVQVGPVPPDCRVEHSTRIPATSIACVNPRHGELIMPPARKARLQALAAQYIQARQGVAA
jgi:hypothetical protein